MIFYPFSKLRRWSSAVQLRMELFLELKRASRAGHHIARQRYKDVWKEPQNQEEYIWLLRFSSPSEKVQLIDIGGNSGYWAAQFLEYFPGASIFAFEPVKAMFDEYKKRFKDWNNVRVYNAALGNTKEQKTINVASGYGLTSFHKYSENLLDRNMHFVETEVVSVKKLDDFDLELKEEMFTIVKVDVQGFETNVVRGGLSIFTLTDVAIIECSFVKEYEGVEPTFGELVELLRSVDLHPVQFGVFDRKRSPIAYERNVLFIKSSLFDRIWS